MLSYFLVLCGIIYSGDIMAKRIKKTVSKNSVNYYIIDDFTDPSSGKKSSFIVEKFGNMAKLKKRFDAASDEDALSKLNDYVLELKKKDKDAKADVSITLSSSALIEKNKQRVFNIGYLYPLSILKSLGITDICKEITQKYQFKYDICDILCDLVCARIIDPKSKRASYEVASSFLESPSYELHDVYRALRVLCEERYLIESRLYSNSKKIYDRNTSILYYDCTNFFFEIEDETDFCKYGKSKENRPNPIVQYGLFTDADGIPIADITFEGNKNEQFSMKELEEEIERDFSLSKFIVCADAGLNGFENKVYNDMKHNGAFIVTQPVKKMNKTLKEWALDRKNWKLTGFSETFDISDLGDEIVIEGTKYNTRNLIFYKERWDKTSKKTELTGQKYELEEHYIVTYSKKYSEYQKYIREKKLERARKLLKNPGKIGTKNPRDPRYYITQMATTSLGEVAEEKYYSINESLIAEDERFDGIYAVTTDLEDDNIQVIINANKRRWEIEENFEIMKSEFKARPMYMTQEEAVKGHLLTCFISLLVYRLLEKKHLNEKETAGKIISTLKNLNVTYLGGNIYVPSFTRTDTVDLLAEEFGFQPSKEVLTQKYLKKFLRIVKSKKSTKMK